MLHAEVQCPIAPHRDAADPTGFPIGDRPVLVIDCRDEFLDEEIFVAFMAVKGVYVETLAPFGHHHNELADLPLAHQTFPSLLPAVFTPAPGMFKEAMKVIKHRISLGPGLIARRQRDAIIHRAAEDGLEIDSQST